MEKIKLDSRYKEVITELELIPENRGILTTTSLYIRVIQKNDDESIGPQDQIKAVDFEGGPLIGVGGSLHGRVVKSITNAFLVEFEDDLSSNKSSGAV